MQYNKIMNISHPKQGSVKMIILIIVGLIIIGGGYYYYYHYIKYKGLCGDGVGCNESENI